MNTYDDEHFFSSYTDLRNGLNYNDLLETPAMLSLAGDVRGKRIIDLGCGFGKTDKELVRLGAEYILGIDISERMIGKARNEYSDDRIEYRAMSLEKLDALKDERFDIAYSSLCFHYIRDLGKLLRDIHRLLMPHGMLIFSQEHPITTADYDGGFSPDNASYTFSSYLKEGIRRNEWFDTDITTYHRTFGTIATTLARSGFSIDEILEPAPSEEAVKLLPRIRREYEKPSFLIIKSYKK